MTMPAAAADWDDRGIAARADDPDLVRILRLPRSTPASTEQILQLTRQLTRPGCGVELRQKQTEALIALRDAGGTVAVMPTGEGKTLVTLLAPTLLAAERPVLMLPANCRDKTRDEFAEYLADGWAVRLPRLLSYETLSHPKHERDLVELAPDLLMLDEADLARNVDGTGFGRRIRRALRDASPRPRVAVLSATLLTDDLLDYWELVLWALQDQAPVPTTRAVAERWASALAHDVPDGLFRTEPGALELIPGGFAAHLRGTRGVVCGRGEQCPAEITITPWVPPIPPNVRGWIEWCQDTGQRPDGEPMTEWELPDLLCTLSLGFFQIWDPLPPTWWLQPRRAYLAYERAVIEAQIDGIDTPAQVRAGLTLRDHVQPPEADIGRTLLAAWSAVSDRFEPNPVPVWLSGDVLDAIAAKARPGLIVWVKHVGPGVELARRGLPYYGADTSPQHHRPLGAPIVCSIKAHGRGKNLQHGWHDMLITHPMAKARGWEQLISRVHRPGLVAPHVGVEVITGIEYHGQVLERVYAEAERISADAGFPHKLTIAKWI